MIIEPHVMEPHDEPEAATTAFARNVEVRLGQDRGPSPSGGQSRYENLESTI